jgi:hypothetical protein
MIGRMPVNRNAVRVRDERARMDGTRLYKKVEK